MADLQSRTRYEPAQAEPRIIARWLQSGLFSPDPEGGAAENYSIAIPPPNVTGVLHMGHALNGTIQDVLVRYQRMRGRRTKWIFGTDHAGIATQAQVERQLRAEGLSREQIGREAFLQRVWAWRELYGSQIVEQFQRLGASCDYRDERFTMDPAYAEAVTKVFVALYREGLIYRDNYLVNWDPGSGSAISDLEVESREVVDALYDIAYPIEGSDQTLVIATVRPETMLADTAVAVHPDDERYRDLVGRHAILPLVGRRLPIIADEYVKRDFGTGALKITPGHDPNDFEIGRRHGLEELSIIGEDGRLTEAAGERFAGLTTLEARQAVLAALEVEGRLVGSREYRHEVPFSHRSGERIEPLISLQWFMRMDELARPAIEAVSAGRIAVEPAQWARVYVDWLADIRPWCVSRQLWWGHRLPVYYCDECAETHVAEQPPAACERCGGALRRDEDVLDTWFSSALWPFATLGWPQDTPALRAFYPTDVLVTARDIIFLWVTRMVMMGLKFTEQVPFEQVYITSIIQAPDGRRMSKSLGTGIDPLDEIAEHGADAVRFGLLAMSSSQDVRYSKEKIQQGQNLANKLWNASRLVLLQHDATVGDTPAATAPEPDPRTVEDRWILSRLQRAKQAMAERIDELDFAHAALGLYDFVYGELCDWYLEWVKPRLYGDAEQRDPLLATLLHVLVETLALAHPILPFVTEEIWSELGERVPGVDGLLAGARYPQVRPDLIDEQAERRLEAGIATVQALRGWRELAGARPGVWLPARLEAEGYEGIAADIGRLARFAFDGASKNGAPGEGAGSEGAGGKGAGGEEVASIPVPGGVVAVLASDAVDVAAARERLAARRAELEREIARAESRLANAGFVGKAPPAVVEAERAKLERLRADREAL